MTKEVSIISQLHHENETWKRVLEFITDENIHLKNRLSDILRDFNEQDHRLLEKIELFHNRLLHADDITRKLRKEVADKEIILEKHPFINLESLKDFQKKQQKLMKDLHSAETEFNDLKYEFNSYLGEIL